jgi:hypothetical protein
VNIRPLVKPAVAATLVALSSALAPSMSLAQATPAAEAPATSLQIDVKGTAEGTLLQVQIDGKPVPPGNLATPLRLDPGEHTIAVQATGYFDVRQDVTLAESVSTKIEVLLFPAPDAKAPAAVPTAVKAMAGKKVVLTTKSGDAVSGKLLSADESGLAIEKEDHTIVLLPRGGARSVRLAATEGGADAAMDAPAPAQPKAPLDHVVNLDSENPNVGLYRQRGVLGEELVCLAPCGVSVNRAAGDDFYLAIKEDVLGDHFSLPTSPEAVTLKVKMHRAANRGRKIGGAVLLTAGLLDLAVGSILVAVDWGPPSNNNVVNNVNVDEYYQGIGIGNLVLGGICTVSSIVLLALSGGSYDVTLPGSVRRVTSQTFPRLTGVAFSPPMPSPLGLSPASAMATWEF